MERGPTYVGEIATNQKILNSETAKATLPNPSSSTVDINTASHLPAHDSDIAEKPLFLPPTTSNPPSTTEKNPTKTSAQNSNNAAPFSPYTLLSPLQRRLIAIIVGLAGMFSPLTANIYLPCISILQTEFDTTLQLMNLTITGYVVIQGIAPSFFTQLAEKLGRRPVYLLTFSLFVASSIGLALNDRSYTALLVLRMVQSFGSSVSTSMGYAVVADIAAPSERGRFLGPTMMMLNLGPVIAPVVGGPLCYSAGWRWIFWLLAILGSVFLVIIVLFLPETNRKLVGNGGIAAEGWQKPVLSFLVPKAEVYERQKIVVYFSVWAKARAIAPNPFKSVALIFQKDTFCVLLAAGIFYMMYYVSQASLPTLYKDAYGYDESVIGLCYLALATGVFTGSIIQARIMDWNYKKTALKIGWEVNHTQGDDMSKFPIEKARARRAWVFHILQCSFALGYGWAINYRVHPAIPLILQFFQGLTGYVQSWNTLTVEIHRDAPSTASAAGNLSRCFLSAAGVAAMDPLMRAIGVGPYFTLLSTSVIAVGLGLVFVIRKKGMEWRITREKKATGK